MMDIKSLYFVKVVFDVMNKFCAMQRNEEFEALKGVYIQLRGGSQTLV
jgi:hypothetical protein